MANLHDLPKLDNYDTLPSATEKLRAAVDRSPQKVGKLLNYHRTTIRRFEQEENGFEPPLGYLAWLVKTIVDRLEERGHQTEDAREQLRHDLNKVLRHSKEKYWHRDPFETWNDVERRGVEFFEQRHAASPSPVGEENSDLLSTLESTEGGAPPPPTPSEPPPVLSPPVELLPALSSRLLSPHSSLVTIALLAIGLLIITTYYMATLQSTNSSDNDRRATDHFKLGVAHHNKGNQTAAIEELTHAIDLRPGYIEAYVYRARSYIEKSEYDHALADLNQAITFQPDYAAAFFNRGRVHLKKLDYVSAIADFSEAIRLNYTQSTVYYGRGVAYYNMREYARAIVDLNKAISIDQDYGWSYIFRGLAYKATGDREKAINDFNTARNKHNDSDSHAAADRELKTIAEGN